MTTPIDADPQKLQGLERAKRLLQIRIDGVRKNRIEAEQREGELKQQMTALDNRINEVLTTRGT